MIYFQCIFKLLHLFYDPRNPKVHNYIPQPMKMALLFLFLMVTLRYSEALKCLQCQSTETAPDQDCINGLSFYFLYFWWTFFVILRPYWAESKLCNL